MWRNHWSINSSCRKFTIQSSKYCLCYFNGYSFLCFLSACPEMGCGYHILMLHQFFFIRILVSYEKNQKCLLKLYIIKYIILYKKIDELKISVLTSIFFFFKKKKKIYLCNLAGLKSPEQGIFINNTSSGNI